MKETFTIRSVAANGLYAGRPIPHGFKGDMVISKNLGLVRLEQDLDIKGDILAEAGSGLRVDGNIMANTIKSGLGVMAEGDIDAKSIEAEADVSSLGTITASEFVRTQRGVRTANLTCPEVLAAGNVEVTEQASIDKILFCNRLIVDPRDALTPGGIKTMGDARQTILAEMAGNRALAPYSGAVGLRPGRNAELEHLLRIMRDFDETIATDRSETKDTRIMQDYILKIEDIIAVPLSQSQFADARIQAEKDVGHELDPPTARFLDAQTGRNQSAETSLQV